VTAEEGADDTQGNKKMDIACLQRDSNIVKETGDSSFPGMGGALIGDATV